MKKVLTAGVIALLCTAVSQADVANLVASQDASVFYRSGTGWMDVNSGVTNVEVETYNFLDGSAIASWGYVQFDMSSLGGGSSIQINSATLTLTQAGSNPANAGIGGGHDTRNDTITTDRLNIYGLLNLAGNTAQNWDESTLTWNTTGSEMDASSVASGSDQFNVGTGRSADFSALDAVSGGVATLSDASVTSFLQGRVDDNGLVTFMFDIDDTAKPSGLSGFAFNSSEAGSGQPLLTLDYTVIPEPATLGLIGMASIGLLAARRFRM